MRSKSGWQHVALGRGEIPLAEAARLLIEAGFAGYLTFEHDKRWQPDLAEPEHIFPEAIRWFKQQMEKG